jgi:hypothetical protein
MTNVTTKPAADWLGRVRTNILAWWFPTCAMLAGLFVATPVRTVIWIVALAWMGTACILNARRCGRTHCRFTGPYYLAMIVPVLAFGEGIVPSGFYGWLALGAVMTLAFREVAADFLAHL